VNFLEGYRFWIGCPWQTKNDDPWALGIPLELSHTLIRGRGEIEIGGTDIPPRKWVWDEGAAWELPVLAE